MRSNWIAALLFGLLVGVTASRAQPDPVFAPSASFIHPEANRSELLGDTLTWNHYLEKMDRLIFEGRGQINVVHVGGSHIQADMWSMQMRQRMQHMVPGVRGSRGLIFPY